MKKTVVKVIQVDDCRCIICHSKGTEECGILEGRLISEKESVSYIIEGSTAPCIEQTGADRCIVHCPDGDKEIDLKHGRSLAASRGWSFLALTPKPEEEHHNKFKQVTIRIDVGKTEPSKEPEVPSESNCVLVKDGKYYIIKDGKKRSAPASYALEYAEKNGLKVIEEDKSFDTEPGTASAPGTGPSAETSSDRPEPSPGADAGSIPGKTAVRDSEVLETMNPKPENASVRGNPETMDLAPAPEYVEREQVPPFIVLDLPLAGEDAPPVAAADGADGRLIVCDGMGGAGGQHIFLNGEVRTMAFAASRCVIATADEFIRNNHARLMSDDIGEACTELGKNIASALESCAAANSMTFRSRGTMGRFLPTTIAAVAYRDEGDSVSASVIWAGDSRVYCVLPDSGLHPLTIDDSKGNADDLASIFQDAPMSNTVSLESPFHINYRRFSLPKPCMLFASSDGVSQYAGTPMNLEKALITRGERQIAESMLEFLRDHPFDDRSFSAAIIGCDEGEFEACLSAARGDLIDSLVAKAADLEAPFKEKQAEYNEAKKEYRNDPTEEKKAHRDELQLATSECQAESQKKMTELWESSYKTAYYGLTPDSEGVTGDIVSGYAAAHRKKSLEEILAEMDGKSGRKGPNPITEPAEPPVEPETADGPAGTAADIIVSAGHLGKYTVVRKEGEGDGAVVHLDRGGKKFVCYAKPADPYDKTRKKIVTQYSEDSFAKDEVFAVVYMEYTSQELHAACNITSLLIDLMEQISRMHSNGLVHGCLSTSSIIAKKQNSKNKVDAIIQNHIRMFKVGDSPADSPAEAVSQGTAYDIACIGDYIISLIGDNDDRAFGRLKDLGHRMSSPDPSARPSAAEALEELKATKKEL